MAELWASLETWLGAHPHAVTLAGLVLAVIGTVTGLLALRQRRGLPLVARLADPHGWPARLEALNPSPARAYITGITRISDIATRLYGPRLLSRHAFGRALQFALCYPILSLLLGWLFFDAGDLGGTEFIPEGMAAWQRGLIFVATLASSGVVFMLIKYDDAILAFLHHKLTPWRQNLETRSGFLAKLGGWIVAALPALIWLSAVAVTVAGAVTGAVAVAPVVAVAVVVAAITGNTVPTAIFLFFFALLPLLNAAADLASVAATRWFLRQIQSSPRHPAGARLAQIITGLLLDLLIAALCLAALLAALIGLLTLWGQILPAALPLDWRAWLGQICAGDRGRGMMLWLMLMTTLIPTALHLAAGLGAILTRNARIDQQIHAILAPRAEALRRAHGPEVFDLGGPQPQGPVITQEELHRLDRLYAKREGRGTAVFLLLVVLFMALMLAALWGLSQSAGLTACTIGTA